MSISPEMQERIAHLAKLAARKDHEEGGHRVAGNVLALLAWSARVKQDHMDCGRMQPVKRGVDIIGVNCPVHGFRPAPEWKER